ncbi:MAG: DNA polymerase III subunit gamma/tau [Mogibacterium sp.]|nr:DNA polymerase III subunit gamma/tau [Mogibacterium sp.]
MQRALYRAERPEVFEDIIGQKHIVKILQNQIRTGTVSQAYLFSGTHGTGKTSTARILAKAVNCTGGVSEPPCGRCDNCEAIREGRFVDVIELDAASNNGVDDLRAIIEMVKYPPTIGKYKVYIIDEVHMLSTAAENAFLKTLEEPPEHAIFILATTDPQKVRQTIRSRCMQLNFKRVTEDELIEGMDRICAKRGISATRDALATIASRADGSVRDALSILEQCIAAGDKELTRAAVLEYTGAAGEDFFLALTGAVIAHDAGKALIYIDEIVKRGKDTRQILKDWLRHMRDLMIVKYVGKAERIIGASTENIDRLRAQAEGVDAVFIEKAIRLISEYINIGRYSERPRILLETAAVRLAAPQGGISAVKAGSGGPAAKTVNAARPERRPAPVPEPEDDVPAGEALADMIASAPREQTGDPGEMWDLIVREMSASDKSFMGLIGRNSAASAFDAGQLIVKVSPGKLSFAEDMKPDINRVAKELFGPDIYVDLKGGEIRKSAAPQTNNGISEDETSRILDEDISVNEVMEDVEELFGIKPVLED